jgi:hypothetical protein
MKSRIRDTVLTLLGITALIVYVLACRPSFSPDGTKVVFPLIDRKARQTSVVVYDVKKKTVETIAAASSTKNSGEDKDEVLAYSAQWLPQGRQVLANGISLIMILPVGSQSPTRILTLDDKLEAGSLIMPPPVIGNYQFLVSSTSVQEKNEKGQTVTVDKPAILRVNLDTWDTVTTRIRMNVNLIGNGTQLFYTGETQNGDQDVYEIGRLDPEKVTQNALLQLRKEEYGELTGFLSPNKKGDRFAITAHLDDAARVLLVRGSVVEKVLSVAGKESGIRIGNAEWSPDEKKIFAAFIKKLDKDGNAQFGILEVPLDGGSIHELSLFTGKSTDDTLWFYQIALSPDGRQVAASSVCVGSDGDIKPQDHALYLVDVSSSAWNVTKVPVPFPSEPKSGADKK